MTILHLPFRLSSISALYLPSHSNDSSKSKSAFHGRVGKGVERAFRGGRRELPMRELHTLRVRRYDNSPSSFSIVIDLCSLPTLPFKRLVHRERISWEGRKGSGASFPGGRRKLPVRELHTAQTILHLPFRLSSISALYPPSHSNGSSKSKSAIHGRVGKRVERAFRGGRRKLPVRELHTLRVRRSDNLPSSFSIVIDLCSLPTLPFKRLVQIKERISWEGRKGNLR